MNNNILSKTYVSSSNNKTNIVSNIVDLLKHFLHIVINCFFALIIVISAFILIVLIDKGINVFRTEQLPALFDTYEIVSPSMTPTIKVNDAIMIKRTNYKKLKKGDIITFKSSDSRLNGMIITHRINDIITSSNGDIRFITKGDNNATVDDAPVLPKNIYGKVITKVPFYSQIKSLVGNPIFLAVVIVILFGLIVNKTKKNKDIEKEEIELLDYNEREIEII